MICNRTLFLSCIVHNAHKTTMNSYYTIKKLLKANHYSYLQYVLLDICKRALHI